MTYLNGLMGLLLLLLVVVSGITLSIMRFQTSALPVQIAKTSVTTMAVRVKSDKVRYTDAYIEAVYDYNTTAVEKDENGGYVATPHNTRFTFRTKRKVRKKFFFPFSTSSP